MPLTRTQQSLNLDFDVLKRLKQEAKRQKQSMASVVNQVLRKHWGLPVEPRNPARDWIPRGSS